MMIESWIKDTKVGGCYPNKTGFCYHVVVRDHQTLTHFNKDGFNSAIDAYKAALSLIAVIKSNMPF